jgi:hypothetical protein
VGIPDAPRRNYANRDRTRQKSGEDQRMRESAMPAEVAVPNIKSKPDHIKVGNHGADYTSDPYPLRHIRSVKARPDAQGGDRVREFRCHLRIFSVNPAPRYHH